MEIPTLSRHQKRTRTDEEPSPARKPPGGSEYATWHAESPPFSRRVHIVPLDLPVCQLACRTAWEGLSSQEKKYAHHFSMAAWAGARICSRQLSEESPGIMKMLLLLFSSQPLSALQESASLNNISDTSWRYLLSYAACFLANLGNYLSFGDCKIIPGILAEDFDAIIAICQLQGRAKRVLEELWEEVRDGMYSLEPGERQLSLRPGGVCGYYSRGITADEIALVQEWMGPIGLEAWNTRLWRVEPENSNSSLPEYQLKVASSVELPTEAHVYKDRCVIHVVYGDHREELREVVEHLKRALGHVANDNQADMIAEYIRHFESGSIQAHKNSQRFWIEDRNPSVETNIGFIETYRDPVGSRAEFEGLVAVVNKEKSGTFNALVLAAEGLLSSLPWPRAFESDRLLTPSFTALDVITFASSGIPAGLNIPNYEDVRQAAGFKNFCLGNVVGALDGERLPTPLVPPNHQTLVSRCQAPAFEMQVACHELLGHGSGKLLREHEDGTHNFDREKVVHPFSGLSPVSCYRPGATWDSVFGAISSSFEECRAECVGLLLCTEPRVQAIFGHAGQAAEDVMFVNWLLTLRSGLLALEFYDPGTQAWRQAHMQARFAILRMLLKASAAADSPALLTVRSPSGEVVLERSLIRTVGVSALRDFLCRLQVARATADAVAGRALYQEVHTAEDPTAAGGVRLDEFPATHEGVVASFTARFANWVAEFST